ncbi:MAG: radical SAM protein, partial [Thiolinea sp.]
YVHHEVNGLLYEFRDVVSMAAAMQRLADDPNLARRLGQRGYVQTEGGDVPDIETHVSEIESIYDQVIQRRRTSQVEKLPGPWRITLDTNPDTCNLKCVMCEEHSPFSSAQAERRAESKPPRLMPVEWIERIIAEAAPHGLREVIPSTMGEPLLYEGFERIIDTCIQHRVRLNLTTNGTFPRRGATGWAKVLVPITSDVKISINGATEATQQGVMIGSKLDEVLAATRDFIAVRDAHAVGGGNYCRVTFQVTFLDTNVDELPELVRMAMALGVDRVKGHHLWAHFDEVKSLSMRRNPEAIRRWNAVVETCREVVQRTPLKSGKSLLLENFFPLNPKTPADIAPGGACPFLGQEAWISAEGRFNPCCAPDALRRTLGDFGNISTGTMAIWQSPRYDELLATYSSRSLCLGCNMRKPVEGV